MLTFKSTIVFARAARWFLVSALAALPLILTACAGPGSSALPPGDIQELWDGTWTMTEQGGIQVYLDCCDGPGENIPLTPKYRKMRAEYAAIPFESAEMNVDSNLARCITPGMPGIFQHPMFFEFSWAPGRVNILYHHGTARWIWTDGRSFPERLLPRRVGTSIGHWEGDTLVVETRGISRQSEMFLMGPIKVSPQTKVTERITVKQEPIKATNAADESEIPIGPVRKHLHLQTTLEDPEIFLEPYTYDLFFVEVPILFETGCAAHNRDDGMAPVDLTPPEFD